MITACWDADPAKRPTFTQIIPLFDGIIVDAIISDPVGSKMWKTYFLTDKLREKVSWRNFVIALTNTFKQKMPKDANDTRWKCLKVLLTDNDGNVPIEQFSRMLEWFGPLKELNAFLESVENLLRRPCVIFFVNPLNNSLIIFFFYLGLDGSMEIYLHQMLKRNCQRKRKEPF